MSNPNASPFSNSESDDDDEDNAASAFRSAAKPPATKSISFLLDTAPKAPDQPKEEPPAALFAEFFDRQNKEAAAANAESDDDDDEAESDTKPSTARGRFRRGFKRLFPRVVNKDDSPPPTASAAPISAEAAPSVLASTETTVSESEPDSDEALTTEQAPEPEPILEPTEPQANNQLDEQPPTLEQENDLIESAPDPDPVELQPQPQASTANTASQPPVPPRPPTGPGQTGNLGSGGGGNRGGTPGNPANAGGNIPPIPPGINPNLTNFNLPPQPAAANLNQPPPQEVIIDRRGNVAGPLVAFLAANFLSKRRDKKIQRSVKKLDNELGSTQLQTDRDRTRANTRELQNRTIQREQSQRLSSVERAIQVPRNTPNQIRQTISAEQPPLQPPTPNIEPIYDRQIKSDVESSAPVQLAEVLAASAAARELQPQREAPLSQSERVNTTKETQRLQADAAAKEAGSEEVPSQNRQYEQYVSAQRQQQLERSQAERQRVVHETAAANEAAETTRETVFERRHEVKDEPAGSILIITLPPSQSQAAATVQSSGGSSAVASSQNSPAGQSAPTSGSGAPPSQQDIYRQSMRTGFQVGLVVVVLGVIAYLLLR